MGMVLTLSGRAEDALEPIEQALRLDPHDSGRNVWEYYMCDAYAHMAKWEQAAEWCEKSVASNPGYLRARFDLAAAYGWLGRSVEAHAAVAEIQNLIPDFTVQRYSGVPVQMEVRKRDMENRGPTHRGGFAQGRAA